MTLKWFCSIAMGFALLSGCASISAPATFKGPKGIAPGQIRHQTYRDGAVYDLRATRFLVNRGGPYGGDAPLPATPILPDQKEKVRIVPLKSQYPLILGDGTPGDVTIRGGSFTGVQHRDLTWRVMKLLYDGCGVLVRSRELMTFDGMRFENVMDAIRPYDSGRFRVTDVYARYIRDDFVENDALLAGEIRDTLVDGAFVFLSARPSPPHPQSEGKTRSANVTTITNTAVRIMAMPFDIANGGKKKIISPKGLAPGMIFKWSWDAGTVSVSDCVFYVETMGANGRRSMEFAPGTYRNVTLVWGDSGAYPAPIPPGVSVTSDRRVWEKGSRGMVREKGSDSSAGTLSPRPRSARPSHATMRRA